MSEKKEIAPEMLSEWGKFYEEVFNLCIDLSEIPVPKIKPPFFWSICVSPKLTIEDAFSGGEEQLQVFTVLKKSWNHDSSAIIRREEIKKGKIEPLDDLIDVHYSRDAWREPYIVMCRPNYEVDADTRFISADKLIKQKVDTMTLKERLLLGRFIFWKEGRILDCKKTGTYCTGSRMIRSYADIGHIFVPTVNFQNGCVRIDACAAAGHSYLDLNARKVIAPIKPLKRKTETED